MKGRRQRVAWHVSLQPGWGRLVAWIEKTSGVMHLAEPLLLYAARSRCSQWWQLMQSVVAVAHASTRNKCNVRTVEKMPIGIHM